MNPNLEFQRRISQIPLLGIGLSVDVYSPDLRELMVALDCDGLSCAYLEIFKASHGALRDIRSQFPSTVLNYHAEGLWVSQPNWETEYSFREELETAANHLEILDSYWLNQECASKQMVGYSFGTYLPPLFTEASAAITASNAASMQTKLDARMGNGRDRLPLLLLETPPLTYFGFGNLFYPEFFRCLADSCSCGLVLDIGHVWTVFRYSGACRYGSLQNFLDTFLQTFPLERVVQIHLAGLDCHPTLDPGKPPRPTDLRDSKSQPYWVDSHGAPIPEVLWDMLDCVLQSPKLVNLKGIALEVDTKPIGIIVEEFSRFQKQFEWWAKDQSSREIHAVELHPGKSPSAKTGRPNGSKVVQELVHEYQWYVSRVTGGVNSRQKSLEENTKENERQLEKYVHEYVPHEILVWGGDLRDMFPHTIQRLEELGIDLSTFVTAWFNSPRSVQEPYDFFLLKISYFVEFVEKTCPSLGKTVSQEAKGLREGYMLANDL